MSWLRLMEEKIKQTELVTAADGEETKPLHATGHKNKLKNLVKEMWAAYLIEIFVIILGISITLALEEWRDNAKERRLEQVYLKNLLTDIGLDRQSLANTSHETQTIIDRGNELLAHIRNPDSGAMSFGQLVTDVRAILGRPKFQSNDATFSDLKSSGNLHLIEDIQLKNVLFSYYNEVQSINNNQDAEQQATIALSGSYFLRQIPLDDSGRQANPTRAGDGLPKDIEFSNNVLLRVSTRKELLGLYQRAEALADKVRNELEKAQ